MASSRSDDSATTARLLRAVERRSQSRAGLVRVVLAVVLYGVIAWAADGLPASEVSVNRQVEAGKALLIIFGISGIVVHMLARKGIGTHVLPYATAVVDAVAVLGNLAYYHGAAGVPGNLTFAFPLIWIIPIVLAANAIYFRPGLQAFVTVIYIIGVTLISLNAGYLTVEERLEAVLRMQPLLGIPPNAVRVAMALSAGLLLILVTFQGRRLLDRAVRETVSRLNLTRYLPRELAPILSDDTFAELRAGRRIRTALLFVDIRASSARAAGMDPADLARFISAFRRRVGRAASRHGGVIDKYIGDGAMIVFGVPRPADDDPARALACAATLLQSIIRWNEKREFDPPVEIGIGVHCGEVFCGVVGEEDRLEFTVLGDAVNVAARLEQATKTLGCAILASADIVDASGVPSESWREVSREPLPGLHRPIVLLSPCDTRSDEPASISLRAVPA